jgi:hypothetical protein
MSNKPDLDLPDDEMESGDRVAELEAAVVCPYCGETVTIGLDPGNGAVQDYMEDCQVCCQPWRVMVTYRSDGGAEVELEKGEED